MTIEVPVVSGGVYDGNILNDLLLKRARKLELRSGAFWVDRCLNLEEEKKK